LVKLSGSFSASFSSSPITPPITPFLMGAFLDHLAGDVERQVGGIDESAHKAEIPRQELRLLGNEHALDIEVDPPFAAPGRQALQFARAYGGEKIATIVASDTLGGPLETAIVNGALAQTRPTITTARAVRIRVAPSCRRPSPLAKRLASMASISYCTKFLAEPPEVGGGPLDYSTERCALDRPMNPTMAACGSRGTGTRVYDIRDPLHPAGGVIHTHRPG
jgi:hypothetical protein